MKIAVLVSGGVDSSVALAQLKAEGHEVTAFYLKIWLEDELSFLGDCPWNEDLSYVRAVCEQLEVPLEIMSLQQTYWDRVVSYVIDEVKAGRTPNPDMLCNQHVKFGAFLDAIDAHGEGSCFEKVATGHYAQVTTIDGVAHLCTSPDPVKDQTYFLAYLSQRQVARALFPIGHLTKAQLRIEAERLDLPNKARKDSQGICFLGKLKFSDFIRFHVGEQVGDLIEFETGLKVGEHPGFWFYTIGQRQGIGLSGGPWYVVAKDPATNQVFISKTYYTPEKVRNSCSIERCNWIAGSAPRFDAGEAGGFEVKLRHGPVRYPVRVTSLDDGAVKLELVDSNDQGIAPGQFGVLYRGDECLGGGVIRGV